VPKADEEAVLDVKDHEEDPVVQKQLHKDPLQNEEENCKKHKLKSKVQEEHLELLCVQQAKGRLPTEKLLQEQRELR
jgi:hypothetical protein